MSVTNFRAGRLALACSSALATLYGGTAFAAPCTGPGAPTTTQTKCLTAVTIPGNALRSFDISWVNPDRTEYYLGDRSNAGIDIVASPPGKRLQNVLLLSGGEKAMTALALLIAIFRYQPSPFCILDEVDAPLDEANVGRFTRLIGDMSAQTQFIIVTHNRKTMETGSVLYGVTMQEPGVSKLVSVRWEGDQAPAPKHRAVSAA